MKSYKGYNLEDTLIILDKYKEKGKIIAGGTDVVIAIKEKHVDPEIMIDISDIEELTKVEEKNGWIHMGSCVKYKDIEGENVFLKNLKAISQAAKSVGSPQIRNTGTIGGNICNGSPAADIVPPLLALDSICIIKSVEGEREIPLKDIFLDKGKVDIKSNEILKGVKFKTLGEREIITFSKLGFRKALAISRAVSSIYIKLSENESIIEKIRIASGSLGKYGLREIEVEEDLKGKILDKDTISFGAEKMSEAVKNRLGGRFSAEYKVEAIKGIFRKSFQEAYDYFKKEI